MIQILLCDDEVSFSDFLRDKIRKILNDHQIPASIFCYQDAREIPSRIISDTDIFFLDIDFARQSYNGLDIAKRLRSLAKNSILIFVTNYVQYAPEGYEIQAFRYLLKNEVDEKLQNYLLLAIEKLQKDQEKITVLLGGEPTTLKLKEIMYLQSEGHTVHIHTACRTISVYGTISQWEEKLHALGFLRTQRSYLVNMAHIKSYQCDRLVLQDQTVLPVSEKFYREQKKEFLLWKGQQ